MNKRPDYKALSLWWRSRTPEEKNAGFDVRKYRIYPTICITVPVPFCGLIEVFLSSPAGSTRYERMVSKRALEKLRRLYLSANAKGWIMHQVKGGVQFWRDGRIVNQMATTSAERFLWS